MIDGGVSVAGAIYAELYPGRLVVVRTLPPGALACPRCEWRSTYTAEYPQACSRSYFCPACSRAGRPVTALQEVAGRG